MLRTIQITILATLILAGCSSVFASTYNSVDISTGIKADLPGNPVYGYGDQDKFWRVITTPDGNNLGNSFIPVLTNYPFVAYTVIPGTTYINSNQTDIGNYEYERCFCLDNPEKAQLSITLRADNTAKAFLNSYSNQFLTVSHNDSFKKQPGRASIQKGFVKGTNCLRVRVNNSGGITGMDAKVKVDGWGAKEIVEKCCERNPKLFGKKSTTGMVNTFTTGEGIGAAKISKRKCIRQGGTYYEYSSGNNICFPARRAMEEKKSGQVIKQNKSLGWRRDRKDCWNDGGVWGTNSNGSYCLKRLEATSRDI